MEDIDFEDFIKRAQAGFWEIGAYKNELSKLLRENANLKREKETYFELFEKWQEYGTQCDKEIEALKKENKIYKDCFNLLTTLSSEFSNKTESIKVEVDKLCDLFKFFGILK